MENTIHVLFISFCMLTSIAFVPRTASSAEVAVPGIDRLSPQHVEHATFAMG